MPVNDNGNEVLRKAARDVGSAPGVSYSLQTTTKPIADATVSIASSQSMGSNFTSGEINAESYTNASIVLSWSGSNSPRPTVVLEGSNDDTTYVEINGSGIVLKDASGAEAWEIVSVDFKYYRLIYTANTATTGTFTADFYGKAE